MWTGTRPREARASPTIENFMFITIHSIRKWIHFSKISKYGWSEKSNFSKLFVKLTFLQEFLLCSKTYYKFSISYKSIEIPGNPTIELRNLWKTLKKSLWRRTRLIFQCCCIWVFPRHKEWIYLILLYYAREGLLLIEWKFLKIYEKIRWNFCI